MTDTLSPAFLEKFRLSRAPDIGLIGPIGPIRPIGRRAAAKPMPLPTDQPTHQAFRGTTPCSLPEPAGNASEPDAWTRAHLRRPLPSRSHN